MEMGLLEFYEALARLSDSMFRSERELPKKLERILPVIEQIRNPVKRDNNLES